MKHLATFLLTLGMILVNSPIAVSAQSETQVVDNEVILKFPDGIQFHLKVKSVSDIESITLVYGTDGRSCQPSAANQSMEFEPAKEIAVDWDWEWIRSGILPPGTQVWWYWEIVDVSGAKLTTPQETIIVSDQRNDWSSISRDDVTVYWYEGGDSFGESIHTIALDSLDRIQDDLDLKIDDEIHITIYPTAQDVRDALLVTTEWTGGVAFSGHNSMIIGVGPYSLEWAGKIIPHELNHLVVGTFIFNCHGVRLPTWLSEGLAEMSEGPLSSQDVDAVLSSLEEDTLRSLNYLARSFSAYGEDAHLAYLQSRMVVQFLVDENGKQKLSRLLEVMQAGTEIDSALDEVYGFDTRGLDGIWRESLGYSVSVTEPEEAESTPTSVPTVAPIAPLFQASPTSSPTIALVTNTPMIELTSTNTLATLTPTSDQPTLSPTTEPAVDQTSNSTPLILIVVIGSVFSLAMVIIFLIKRRS